MPIVIAVLFVEVFMVVLVVAVAVAQRLLFFNIFRFEDDSFLCCHDTSS